MTDYIRRLFVVLIMALCVSLLVLGGGLVHSKNEKKSEDTGYNQQDRKEREFILL